MSVTARRPITLLIAALGGEGGGVLSGWIVEAAREAGLPVQATSIPGVAQRTGATTYYVEVFPATRDALDGREPVLSLYPALGDIDVMIATELVEAARAVSLGYVTPDRTTLIASTHRIFAIAERSAMGDGRFDMGKLLRAAEDRSRRAILFDADAIACEHQAVINAVLLGALAGSAVLPIPADGFERAIEAGGVAVERNLAAFRAGLEAVSSGLATRPAPDAAHKRPRTLTAGAVENRARSDFPSEMHETLVEAVRRLSDYQDAVYAALYLDRLAPILAAERSRPDGGGDLALTRDVARHLAVRMAYEDVIRVAQIKAAPGRYAQLTAEVRARPGEPVRITEYFKPGIDELCAILPASLARPLRQTAERRGWIDKAYLRLEIRTTTVWGYGRVWLLARLRPWRRRTWRFAEETKSIEAWLRAITDCAANQPQLGREIADCARLIKGYGDTHRRGRASFDRIRDRLMIPARAGQIPLAMAIDAIANARTAALADPDGTSLDRVLESVDEALTQAQKAAE